MKKLIITNTFVFIILMIFILSFQCIFSSDNVLIGVFGATALLMLLQTDLSFEPIKNTIMMIILFFAIAISLLNKNSQQKSIILDNEEENEFEQLDLRALDSKEESVKPYRSYHKSSGGLSTGGIIAIIICALIVLLAALALALLCRRAASAAVVGVIPEFSVPTPHYNIDTPGSAVVTKVI